MVSLHTLKAAIIERRRFLLVMALLGLVVGAAFHLVVPRKYSAMTNLYLVEPSGSDPASAMATDASLLHTNAVAQKAMDALHLDEPVATFLSSYIGTSPSPALLSVKLTASSPTAAVTRANAVAQAFLAFRANEFRQQNTILINGLESQVSSLNTDINQLATQINALSGAAGGTQSSQLSALTSQQGEYAAQVSQLQAEIQQNQLNIATITKGSKVVDQASLVVVSTKRVLASDGLSGLVAGLGLGVLVLVFGAVLSERVRRREDIAAALGAPVELSVGPYKRPRWASRRRLSKRVQQPGPGLGMVAQRLRSRLEAAPSRALCTVAIEATEPAALAVAVLARSLASEGKRVVVVDYADARPLASLFQVEEGRTDVHPAGDTGGPVTVIVPPDDPAAMTERTVPRDADAVLVLATVDPAIGAEHLSGWAVNSLVFISAGRATAERIGAVGHLLRRAGVDVIGAIVIGSGSKDDSVGDLPWATEPSPDEGRRPMGILQAGRS
jgi:capsular polysaccharide biosynthesis protein